jgi:hypothetical protein
MKVFLKVFHHSVEVSQHILPTSPDGSYPVIPSSGDSVISGNEVSLVVGATWDYNMDQVIVIANLHSRDGIIVGS